MLRNELVRLGPQRRDRFRGVVQGYGEAVCLIIVLHVTEYVVVDIAEEVNIRFDTPVVLNILQCGMLVEESAVPSTHLVVRNFIGILDIVLLENLDGFLIQILVDPRWCIPMLVRNELYSESVRSSVERLILRLTIAGFRLSGGSSPSLKFFGKGDIVKERPWVVEFGVPGTLQVLHRL